MSMPRKVGMPETGKPVEEMTDIELSAELRHLNEYTGKLIAEVFVRLRDKERLKQDLERIEETYACGE